MEHSCDYLIVGGGMAGDAAAKGIRQRDKNASIHMICGEAMSPYARPPLSKDLWNKGGKLSDIRLGTAQYKVYIHRSRRALALDVDAHVVTDDRGDGYRYGRLLLATGAEPRPLPFEGDRVICFRTVEDYKKVRKLAGRGRKVVVIGAGFIGSEIAAALAGKGCDVTMIFPDSGIGARLFPKSLSDFLTGYYSGKGIGVRPGVRVMKGKATPSRVAMELSDGTELKCDFVVAGIGVAPELELAKSAGLALADGVVVDDGLRTSATDVFAAGDIAFFHDRTLRIRRRVEHEDNATSMGLCAGRNMAGAAERYDHLPYFYSDLFEFGYEALGEFDSREMDVVEDWKTPFREGVIYYLRNRRVRGVLLWNVWGQKQAARALIAEKRTRSKSSLKGAIVSA